MNWRESECLRVLFSRRYHRTCISVEKDNRSLLFYEQRPVIVWFYLFFKIKSIISSKKVFSFELSFLYFSIYSSVKYSLLSITLSVTK